MSAALPLPMDEGEARQITHRIRLLLDTIADNTEKVVNLIEQAKAGDAWKPLGFASWTAYATDTFGGSLARLERANRQFVTVALAELGMSNRAIAGVEGVDEKTVRNDLAGAEKSAPEGVTGKDGKTYVRNGRPTAAGMEAIAASVPEVSPRPAAPCDLTPLQELRRALRLVDEVTRDLFPNGPTEELVREVTRWEGRLRKRLNGQIVAAIDTLLQEEPEGPRVVLQMAHRGDDE